MEPDALQETLSLVRSAQQGDRAAGERLFERYYPRVLRIVALRMGAPLRELQDCEDLVQEALMDAFRSLERFDQRSEGTFRNWLATIVEHQIQDQWRRATAQKRGGGKVRPLAACGSSVLTASLFPGRGTSPSDAASLREFEERLETALLALDERDRRVIELRRLCGLSYAEISAELDLGAESSARALLARALSRLSAML